MADQAKVFLQEEQITTLAWGIVQIAKDIQAWLQQPEVAEKYAQWKRERAEKAAAEAAPAAGKQK